MIDFAGSIQGVLYQLILNLLRERGGTVQGGRYSRDGISSAAHSVAWQGSGKFEDVIQEAAMRYGVDSTLIRAVVKAESNFNPDVVSKAGAQGLMQLMPGTADWLGVNDPFDPVQNVDGGTRYLRRMLDRYGGNVSLALAAYNAGPGAVDQYDGIPPYRETQTYVKRVIGLMESNNTWSA